MSGAPETDRTESRQIREMLSRLQDETRRKIEDFRREQHQESDSGPADEMNSSSAAGEIETRAGLIAMAEEKLKCLDEAIERLDAGKYGRCLKCRGTISIERLRAIPFASYCVNCQKELNRERGGWGHAPFDHLGPQPTRWSLRPNANLTAPSPRSS